MRTRIIASLVVSVAGVAATASQADGQLLQLAERGPAFVYTPPGGGPPVDASSAAVLRRRVTLDLTDVPLRDALREITGQSGLRFAYDPQVVPSGTRVTIQARNINVAGALAEILADANIDVKLETNHQATLVSRSATLPWRLRAEAGTVSGHVRDGKSGSPVPYATVYLEETRRGTTATDSGTYRITDVPPGSYTVAARALGYVLAKTPTTVAAGQSAVVDFALEKSTNQLERMTISAQRLGESKAAALEHQQAAPNIVTVLSGDEIRALPNANAAEAAARIPGVGIERDEGEGKFIEIRGTEPRLSNVTIDGSHVPGTQFGTRIPKLDAIPSDILAAIEVSKTLTADMDADAIGGSINLVTKTPEGSPKGYVSGQAGQTTLLDHRQWQGGVSYGGRFGSDQRLGFLLGTSLDHNDRVISDVEPSWAVDGAGNVFPTEWSQREFLQNRSRFGIGGDLDYRYGDHSTVYAKGLFSEFHNFGYRYQYDVAFAGDSAPAGATGFGTGAVLTREIQNRTPRELLYGLTTGGRNERGALAFDYSFNWAGTRQSARDYRFNPFVYSGGPGGLTMSYNYSTRITPKYGYLSAADSIAAITPANYALTGYRTFDSFTSGRDLGGAANLLWHYDWGANTGALKVGVRLRDEVTKYIQNRLRFSGTGSLSLATALSDFSNPNYYSNVTNAYQLGPLPSNGAAVHFVDTHQFAASPSDSVANAVASFNGSERILAGYVMNTVDVGPWRLNVGLRVENTHSDYTGHVAQTPVDTTGTPTGPTTVSTVPGSQTYTDVFPSAQLRFALDESTNIRLAVTRGIARPNYSDLAPSLVGQVDFAFKTRFSNLTAGNPNLRPQHAWNYDLLFEHFIPVGGVASAGVFYKSITDFIYTREFIYNGPVTAFDGYGGTQPQNGGSGHLLGFEMDWTQHLTFLPGFLSGLGYDVNWTHVDSKATLLPKDTSAAGKSRDVALPRQSPNLANVAGLYDFWHISARIAWQYQGANITSYGDGTPTPNGDTYFYAHSQIDGSIIYSVTSNIQIQLQGLNLNNAVFGFFTGLPGNNYNIQREYYGRSFILGAKYNF